MKNILTILANAGVTLTEDQQAKVTDDVSKNYKPIADWQNQVDKVSALEKTVKDTQDALAKFDGVDVKGLNATITELNEKIAKQDEDYKKQIADRDFDSMVNDKIRAVNGKNLKAIKALLEIDDLKASKNQNEDVEKAIKALTEAEDSKMLFGTREAEGTVTPIGSVGKAGAGMDGVEKAFFDRTGVKLD